MKCQCDSCRWAHEITLAMGASEPHGFLQDLFDSECQRAQHDRLLQLSMMWISRTADDLAPAGAVS